jgi:hypothetical protein
MNQTNVSFLDSDGASDKEYNETSATQLNLTDGIINYWNFGI